MIATPQSGIETNVSLSRKKCMEKEVVNAKKMLKNYQTEDAVNREMLKQV